MRHALDPRLRRQLWRLSVEIWRGLCDRRVLPLQCLIYLPHWQLRPLLAARAGPTPEIVYLDGIRAAPFLPALRRAFPRARVVLDMDDLMSRRWASWRRAGVGLTVGFLERYLPAPMLRAARDNCVARRVVRFEARRLRALELEAAGGADLVVLNSPVETEPHRRFAARGGRRAPALATILPPAPRAVPVRWTGRPTPRFVFIGADQLPQNWLMIDYLVDVWRRLTPQVELVVVGRSRRAYPAVPNVVRSCGRSPGPAARPGASR